MAHPGTDALVVTFNANSILTTNKPSTCENAGFEGSTLVHTFTDAKWAINDNTLSITPVGQTKTDFQYTLAGNKLTLSQSTPLASGTTLIEKLVFTKQ